MICFVNMATMKKYDTNSLIRCGIVNSDPMLYHNQLRHFAQTRTLIHDVETLHLFPRTCHRTVP